MANYVLPMVARKRRAYPYWADAEIAAGQVFVKASDSEVLSVKQGLVLLGGNTSDTYIPIASGLTANKIEVLVKLEKIHAGDQNYANTGGTIVFRPTTPNYYKNGYQFCLGSGTSNGVYVYNYTRSGGFDRLSTATITSLNTLNRPLFMRARVNSGALSFKVWFADTSEPTAWSTTATDAEHEVTNIGFLLSNYNQVLKIHGIAYATNGDTASFATQAVVDVVAGSVVNAKSGDIVNIHDLATHDIIDSIELPTSGAWVSELYNNKPVYGRIERASSSEYDFLFAKYGNTYLGGDYPDGAVKDDGVPSEGEVSVLYRSNDPILGGATIAKVSAAQSGEWRISGLQPNVPFDVVARKPNRRDALVSSVVGVPDPDFKFALLGQLSNNNSYLTGLVLAKGAAEPITPTLLGTKPYGFSASDLTVNGNKISSNLPLRDYGNFSFDMRITDANAKSVDSRINIVDGQRAPFVDFIGASNSMDRNSGTTPIKLIIPAGTMPGDMLVIGLMRRGSVTISDNNLGVWTLSADVFGTPANFEQGASIYTRAAKAGDASKEVSVNAPYSGRLIAYLSVYRGKFAPLEVKSGRAGPLRYDNTYSAPEKNLEPINHSSGFLIRAISTLYTFSSDSALMVVSNMTPTGPTFGLPYRLQVSYAHLGKPGVFSCTYKTGSENTADTMSDVSIILDEIRP